MPRSEASSPVSKDVAESGLRSWLPPGVFAFMGAAASLLTCYGTIFAAAVFGIELLGWNAHLQAVIMWAFGAIALYAMWCDRRQHGNELPIVVGAIAVTILLVTLYVHFERSFEILAYVLLVIAALLNQNSLVSALSEKVGQQASEIQQLNVKLSEKVESQVREIERLDRLREFLSPHVAELVARGKDDLLTSHRRYIACLFCDVRNFSALSEGVEPEDTIAFLQEYHDQIGRLADSRNGTIGFRAGDGIMIFFNDPVPCEQPVLDAVTLGLEVREAMRDLRDRWHRLGFPVGIGIGITAGYATLGLIGTVGGAGYTAIGNPVNIAARLCDQTEDREILIDQRAFLDVERLVNVTPGGQRCLKGLSKPIETYLVSGLQ